MTTKRLLALMFLLVPLASRAADKKPAAKTDSILREVMDIGTSPESTPVLNVLKSGDDEALKRESAKFEPCADELRPPAGATWNAISLSADPDTCALVRAGKSVEAALIACYGAALARKPEVAGHLVVKHVANKAPVVSDRSGLDAAAARCVVDALRPAIADAPGGELTLVFSYFGASVRPGGTAR